MSDLASAPRDDEKQLSIDKPSAAGPQAKWRRTGTDEKRVFFAEMLHEVCVCREQHFISGENAMNNFIQKDQPPIKGSLSCWDRVVFRGVHPSIGLCLGDGEVSSTHRVSAPRFRRARSGGNRTFDRPLPRKRKAQSAFLHLCALRLIPKRPQGCRKSPQSGRVLPQRTYQPYQPARFCSILPQFLSCGPQFFSRLSSHDLPLVNMPYFGTILIVSINMIAAPFERSAAQIASQSHFAAVTGCGSISPFP